MPSEWHPTDVDRRQVEAMSGFGVPHDDIACILDIDPKTLRKHCRRELDLGMAKANAKIGQTLFQQATNGNIAAAIFWAKSRMGWREKHELQVTGPNGGPIRLAAELTRDELMAIAATETTIDAESDQ